MGTAGKVGAIFAPTLDINDEIDTGNTTDTFSGDGTTTAFTLNNEYVLLKSETVTVAGTETDDYEINYITGIVTFDEAPAAGTDNITVEYDYLVEIEQVGGFFEWSFNEDAGLEEAAEFGDDHQTHVATIAEWSGSADKYFSIEDRFENWLGEEVVIAFYIDNTAGEKVRFEGWGKIGSKGTECPHDTLVEQSIDFEGQDFLVFRQG